ncbi:hypothetical protein [Lentzea kentuckyensis]|uniref:hypothetical protein n=1 Tax=Lentzea kentuckyensis TaxID=360086 RepID=UPI000A37424F|nr:hypothetical protein [Lentzea kentuckyensis]
MRLVHDSTAPASRNLGGHALETADTSTRGDAGNDTLTGSAEVDVGDGALARQTDATPASSRCPV